MKNNTKKNISRKNKKLLKNVKKYSKKNKINKMNGGNNCNRYWTSNNCSICYGEFEWPIAFGKTIPEVFIKKNNNLEPVKKKIKKQKEINNKIATVSLDSDDVVELPCKHIFHKTCILESFKRSKICPLCRADSKGVTNKVCYDMGMDMNVDIDIFYKLEKFDMKKEDFFSKYKIKILGNNFITNMYNSLINNTTLKILDINEYAIGEYGVQALSRVLNSTILTELNIGENNIGNKGAIDLANALKVNKTLKTLYINDNNICNYDGNENFGVAEIAAALKDNTTLTELYISRNDIGDEGAIDLAEALKINTTLTTLDISLNNIGYAGANALAAALAALGKYGNTTLTKLDISSNHIGENGANALAVALKSNTTLTSLDVKTNGINLEIIKLLNAEIENNKKKPVFRDGEKFYNTSINII